MGSRRVATDNWSYEFIVRLRDRGYLANLNPLVQPYRAQEVARGLLELDPDTLPEPVAGWVALLREEYWREIGRLEGERGVKWGAMVAAGARASTSQRLDPLRPTGDEDVWPWLNAGVWVEAGPVVGEVRLLGDTYLTDDPDGLDPGQRRGARTDHAYVAADFPVASLIVGRLKRNWSRTHTNGLMVSDVSTAYPQLGFELRAWRFALRSFTGELDTFDGLKRYVAAHRLDYATDNFVVSFGESILYASTSGLQVRWLNPFEFLFFDHDNEPVDATQNLMLNLETWFRSGGLVLYGEGFLDDIDVDPAEGQEAEPLVYGFALGSTLSSLAHWLGLGLEYEQVSAWAYRTPNVVDQYSFLQRGLGENYSDYDRLTLWARLDRRGVSGRAGDLPRCEADHLPHRPPRPLAAAQVLVDRVRPGTELGPQQGPRRGQQRERVRGGGPDRRNDRLPVRWEGLRSDTGAGAPGPAEPRSSPTPASPALSQPGARRTAGWR
jgi:hypothetical protein